MPERLECEVLQKAHYINTLTFIFFTFTHSRCRISVHQPSSTDADEFPPLENSDYAGPLSVRPALPAPSRGCFAQKTLALKESGVGKNLHRKS